MRWCVVLLLVAPAAYAGTLQVGPDKQYTTIAAAATAAADGDVIELDAVTFHEAVTWSRDNLTIRGVGGRAVIDMTGRAISNAKGIFVTSGANITIENIEFVGAAVPDLNGAGIRWQGAGSLTVRNCVFRSNEDGILGGNFADNTAVIEFNEFVDNGRGDLGYTHAVYFSTVESVTFRGNWSHAMYGGGADIGHLFKSRARRNFVLYNRLTSEDTLSSYEVNIPQGGEAYVIGNLIQQRVGSQRTMISFGDGDGTQYTGSKLHVVNNTFVNENSGSATFIRTTQADAQLVVANNLFIGAGTATSGGMAQTTSNISTDMPLFVDQAMFDYHLQAGAPAIDAGTDPGTTPAMSLVPASQYVHPRAVESRGAVGAIDVGAFEFGNMPDPGEPGGDAGTDDPPTTPGGCGCAARGGESSAVLVVLIAAAYRRKRRATSSRR